MNLKENIREEFESDIKVEYGIDTIFITFNDKSIVEGHQIKKLEDDEDAQHARRYATSITRNDE